MDSDDDRPPDDAPPKPNATRPAQLHQAAYPWETEPSAESRRDAEQHEIDSAQRDALAAVYAGQLDERERLQDDLEELRSADRGRRDQAADARDQAANVRDQAANVRDQEADARDRRADRREVQADERELTALERHLQADDREAIADRRERESRLDPGPYAAEGQPGTDTSET